LSRPEARVTPPSPSDEFSDAWGHDGVARRGPPPNSRACYMRTERPVKRARVNEGMAAAFASDSVMWTAMGREEPAGVYMPRVTVMDRFGRGCTCHNVTIDEALRGRAGGGKQVRRQTAFWSVSPSTPFTI